MTTATTQQATTVLHCPTCHEQCAVDTNALETAHASGKEVRIACHGCREIFPAEVPVANTLLDVAKCSACGENFSVPPLPTDETVQVQCPLCDAEILSDTLTYVERAGEPVRAKRSWFGWLKFGKSTKKAKTEPDAVTEPDAGLDSDIIRDAETAGIAAPELATDQGTEQASGAEVTPLFEDGPTNQPDNAVDGDTAETADNDTAEQLAETPPAKKKTSRGLLITLLVVLLGAAAAVPFLLQPDAPAKIIDIFRVNEQKPAYFAITNAVYEKAETAIGTSVVITVTLENMGESNGTPGPISIELLDAARQSIMQWPVSTTTLDLDAGERRDIVTRIFEPPQAFDDIQVTLQQP